MVVLPLDPEPDYRLCVYVWGTDSRFDPITFRFEADEHQQALEFALDIANRWEKIFRVQVIDAWGMLIGQFTAAWVYLGEAKFNDTRLGKRPS